MTIGITDHAAERYLQRVRGVLDPRPEIARRVRAAWDAGRVSDGDRGALYVRDLDRPERSTCAIWTARPSCTSV